MSAREWQPGDVALVEAGCWANRKVALRLAEGWSHVNGVNVDGDGIVSPVRPLVVIDPESAEDCERLSKAWSGLKYAELGDTPMCLNAYRMQAALREFATPTPPQPEVFRHFIAKSDGGIKTAECGKVWRLNAEANVTSLGDCETCVDIVRSRWSV